jgi:hypothetical protein
MMSSIVHGPTEAENAKTDSVKSSLRVGIAKSIAAGGGLSIGAAVVFGAFELLHNDSKDAFPLLEHWGPWAFVSIVAVYVLYDLIKIRMNVSLRGVIAMENTAVALTRLSEKDDRQTQQLEVLMGTMVVHSRRVERKMHTFGLAMERLQDHAGIAVPNDVEDDEAGDEQ